MLATVLLLSAMGLIPLLVPLFNLGRAAFWAGYAGGGAARILSSNIFNFTRS